MQKNVVFRNIVMTKIGNPFFMLITNRGRAGNNPKKWLPEAEVPEGPVYRRENQTIKP